MTRLAGVRKVSLLGRVQQRLTLLVEVYEFHRFDGLTACFGSKGLEYVELTITV